MYSNPGYKISITANSPAIRLEENKYLKTIPLLRQQFRISFEFFVMSLDQAGLGILDMMVDDKNGISIQINGNFTLLYFYFSIQF